MKNKNQFIDLHSSSSPEIRVRDPKSTVLSIEYSTFLIYGFSLMFPEAPAELRH